MDGWIDEWMDGRQTGCCSVWNLCVFLLWEKVLFLFFQSIKKDCYDYLTVCPSHFTPHLSSCEYRALLGSFSLFLSLSLSSPLYLSCHLSAYQCCLPCAPCAPCKRVVLYSTEGQRLGNEITLSLLSFKRKKSVIN